MKKAKTIAEVTAALRAEGFPVELHRGNGYLYFTYDDEARGIFEDESIPVCYFGHQTPEQWIVEGRAFALRLRAEHNIV